MKKPDVLVLEETRDDVYIVISNCWPGSRIKTIPAYRKNASITTHSVLYTIISPFLNYSGIYLYLIEPYRLHPTPKLNIHLLFPNKLTDSIPNYSTKFISTHHMIPRKSKHHPQIPSNNTYITSSTSQSFPNLKHTFIVDFNARHCRWDHHNNPRRKQWV